MLPRRNNALRTPTVIVRGGIVEIFILATWPGVGPETVGRFGDL